MTNSSDPIIQTAYGVLIRVKVVPRASKDEISGQLDGAIKIRLQAPPVEGKANKALVHFMAKMLDVSKSAVTILSGETGRSKRVAVRGVNAEEAKEKLLMR
jgi:uncharacterized protein